MFFGNKTEALGYCHSRDLDLRLPAMLGGIQMYHTALLFMPPTKRVLQQANYLSSGKLLLRCPYRFYDSLSNRQVLIIFGFNLCSTLLVAPAYSRLAAFKF